MEPMLQAMILAHFLGDFVFQPDCLAHWKSQSAWGVLAHGAIVTLCLWLCALPFATDWWPYALGIGVLHTLIDLARTKVGPVGPGPALALLLADQAAHLFTIVVALAAAGWLEPHPAATPLGDWLENSHVLGLALGYVLLTMPAWVLVHFLVRGIGGQSTSLPGRPGEKYVGILERSLIATLVLVGQFPLIPLVVAPRLVVDGRSGRVEAERLSYVNELLISVGLALAVGLLLRGLV
ncbi:MAG: DUF3307 domain-containing protein [Chloroflexi bacterium]|nr:DUF3307 domain-containing protein [Chloroflexota bacterium]MBU1749092.1 DUF3307 domain-containing protein [Chloroflexota bacterium]MBU1877378.1 DUF3307 domain-containing protein [Chloroflexota bacterium]